MRPLDVVFLVLLAVNFALWLGVWLTRLAYATSPHGPFPDGGLVRPRDSALGLLETARCPYCDGESADCQWCMDRRVILDQKYRA